MTNSLPICAWCGRQMRPLQNDIVIAVMHGDDIEELRAGDLVECQDCKRQVISGLAPKPIAESWQDDFQQKVDSYQPRFRVKEYTR